MVKIKWDDIANADNYPLLPPGKYPVRVIKVVPDGFQDKERWKLTFVITEGEQKGAHLSDTIFFSDKAMPRFKLICSRLKIVTEGASEVLPEHLLGRECYLDVGIEIYNDNEQNRISFAGYIEREIWLQPAAGEAPPQIVNQGTFAPSLGSIEKPDIPF